MPFFTFMQNNSGGDYVGPKRVIVEADTPEEANEIAQDNDVYFYGCSLGMDCQCCGDRWNPQYDSEDGETYDEAMNRAVRYEDNPSDVNVIRKQEMSNE